MEKKVILLSLPPLRLLPEFKAQLEAAGNGREVLVSMDPAVIEPHLDRIEIGMGDIPLDLVPRMKGFKWWQLWSAGADILQRLPALKELLFKLCISTGMHGQQMTEHLFAMLLGWSRCMSTAYTVQREHKWLMVKDQQLSSLAGKTMLILGYGTIGRTMAKIALAFGMKVTGLCRNPGAARHSEGNKDLPPSFEDSGGVMVAEAAKLKEFLPLSDYVVNILPSTPDTRHYFGAAEFSAMKNSALYINLGRGATTCEADLIDALRKKSIAGALLDVTEIEPLPADSPLWDMDNVIITGHYAGCHPDYTRMAMAIALDNLGRYNRGEPLKNLVDKKRGY
ncbi:MAG: D-2-hydroxyacid dehydrogenase [Treponema sp.]|nr:D-2-hydroxyacid dehydrogenase [Treponema sp.]